MNFFWTVGFHFGNYVGLNDGLYHLLPSKLDAISDLSGKRGKPTKGA